MKLLSRYKLFVIYICHPREVRNSGVAATFNPVSPSSPRTTRLFKKAQCGRAASLSVASPFTSGHINDRRQVTQWESERKRERWWKEVMLQRERERGFQEKREQVQRKERKWATRKRRKNESGSVDEEREESKKRNKLQTSPTSPCRTNTNAAATVIIKCSNHRSSHHPDFWSDLQFLCVVS